MKILLAVLLFAGLPNLSSAQPLAADTPKTTVAGNTFLAPAGWTVSVRGQATLVEAPEGDSRVVLVDVGEAKDADDAVAQAWKAYAPPRTWPLKVRTPSADRDGWTQRLNYDYVTSPNEKREVSAHTRFANGRWTVALYDMAHAVGEKRASQVNLIFGELLPKGYTRETFAGRRAHRLDADRVARLAAYVEEAQRLLGVPGVSWGVVQDGKVVFAGGSGLRRLGQDAKVDGDTLYMVASNTKAMTTLMLGKLADEKKLTWDTPATTLLPSFALGSAETTRQVLVKHLICACTGLPRQDMEWLLEYGGVTPAGALASLATMQPTSSFGELFQYSNPMAAVAGYLGGHVAYPDLELGKAYDEVMRTRVFEPLGMTSTTFDFARALQGNVASAHAPDVDGRTSLALMDANYAIVPVRPAGGAWSNVRDMLRYVQMELDLGRLGDGSRYMEKQTLLARRARQVPTSKDTFYGMGLSTDTNYGTTVVHHGGDMIGYHSDMMWLPDHGVGAVVLTNGDPGWVIRTQFKRKLLEVLFDGQPLADAAVAASAKAWYEGLAAERKLLTVPAAPAAAEALAARYASPALGSVIVSRDAGTTTFDFGEWKSAVASKANPDGTTSFVTLVPGMAGLELVAGAGPSGRTLTLRDAQHEYVFAEAKVKPSN